MMYTACTPFIKLQSMLNRQKLFKEFDRMHQLLSQQIDDGYHQLTMAWQKACNHTQLAEKIAAKKWSMLVPAWQGQIKTTVALPAANHPYTVLAVDGSQIYYDKHQGPACYLMNIGSVLIEYKQQKSCVTFDSQPLLITQSCDEISTDMSPEFVNAYREYHELQTSVTKALQYQQQQQDNPFVCFLDGTLIFFQVDVQTLDDKNNFFYQYMAQCQKLYEHKIVHAAYMSFPRTKDLAHVVELVAHDFDDTKMNSSSFWQSITDMDIAALLLQSGQRSIIFESKSAVAYAYPKHLKPYFCYLHVGAEIIRLEFPQWIAADQTLVDQLCSIALDQAQKGFGYPVVLFEAHEQAVIKSADREFFYEMLRSLYQKNNKNYSVSSKSLKKRIIPC